MQNIHVRPEINASIWVFWKVLYPSHFPPRVKCPVSRDVRYQEMSLIQGVLVRNSSWSLTTSSTTPSQSYLFWRFTANPSKSWNNNVKLGILKRVHLPKLSTFRKIGNVGNFIYEELEMINRHFFNQTFRSYLFWRFETFPLILLQT